jgi:hypothetical protein
MAETSVRVDAMDTIRDSIILTVHVTRVREARARVRLGLWIIKLGAFVAGITTEED